MAIRTITNTVFPRSPDDFVVATSGGTIDGASGIAELAFDDAVYTSSVQRQRLILTLEHMVDFLKETKRDWPLTS